MINNHEMFSRLPRQSIMVIGDIMLDRYLYGEVERISPEAPVPVVLNQKESLNPGGAANVATNLTGLGVQTLLVGTLGSDEAGRQTMGLLARQKKLDCDGVFVTRDRPTTEKMRVVGNHQQICRVDTEDRRPAAEKVMSDIKKFVKRHIDDVSAVILSDYGKGVISKELIEFVLHLKKDRDLVVSVDPKTGHFFYYRHVDLITPNHKEAGEAVGVKITDNDSLKEAATRIVEKLACKNLLITLGPDGMILFNGQYPKGYHIPTEARQVYDVSGAGDTVISVMTAAMTTGAAAEKAARIANLAAGVVVSEFGTTAITLEKLKKT
jgi:D-beta-D-heptose 7-phosphate kinase/D-beta-D-heptose 1-phosphate adenosyltransferase